MSRYLTPDELDGLDDYDRMLVADMDDSRPIYETELEEVASDEALPEPDNGQAEANEAA